MKNIIDKVALFHKVFQNPILDTPQIPKPNRCNLRLALFEEELQELQESIDNNDIVGVADALGDLQYVLLGTVLEFGLGTSFEKIFNEIHQSNMSKACNNIIEAEETICHYANKGIQSYYKEVDNVYLIFRSNDNKNLKSISFNQPQIKNLIFNEDDE